MEENYNSKALVEMWGDFIDWDKRRAGENGFLSQVLNTYGCKRVFESSLGDGCDTIHLLKQGFSVVSNEIDKLFLTKALDNARKEKVPLTLTSYDWRLLGDFFEPESFDAVLCLGNSLTYLFSKNDRIKALKNFRNLLGEHGVLVIDERNYVHMLKDRESILAGNFNYSGTYVYCGNKIHARPVEITDDRVVMRYDDSIRNQFGFLVLYPFKEGELLSELKEAGFSKITKYADFRKQASGVPDFFQYVCEK